VPAHFNFHFGNAYENTDSGEVLFDVVKCDNMMLGGTQGLADPVWYDLDYAKEVPYSKLIRYIFTPTGTDAATGATTFSHSTKELSQTQVDFTSVNPAVSCVKHRYVYAACGSDMSQSSPVQGLVKIDTENLSNEQKWLPEQHEWLGESIFVTKKVKEGKEGEETKEEGKSVDEDDGYILSLLFDGKKDSSEFVVFDAKDITKGPISRQALPVKVPFGLHGSFAQGLTYNAEDVMRRHKACLAVDSKSWNTMTGGFSGLGLTQDMFN